MKKSFGFVRVAAATPPLQVANCTFNAEQIVLLARQAHAEKAAIVCYPELCLTAYTCADLFFNHTLLQHTLEALETIRSASTTLRPLLIVGAPILVSHQLYNCAIAIQHGKLVGVVPKTHIPNNGEFYEKRWFTSATNQHGSTIEINGEQVPFGTDIVFSSPHCNFGIELCEDLWVPLPPSTQLAMQGADLIFNLSASNELIGKKGYREQLIAQQSARLHAGYIYASAGIGESTTDLVFSGAALIAENGQLLQNAERFQQKPLLTLDEIDIERLRSERLRNGNFSAMRNGTYRRVGFECPPLEGRTLTRTLAKEPFVPSANKHDENCHEIFQIQTHGLAKRWRHTQAETLLLGISGGLDSTLALLVCVNAADQLGYDRKRIIGVTMPGFGTTNRTYTNAVELMGELEITWLEIDIKAASLQHFTDINHPPHTHDITYENTQARERTKILMNLANKHNGLVVGTGDLSELALGWATYNGDHMSMYGVNSGVPKTLVRHLVAYKKRELKARAAAILQDILETPVSPELLPANEKGEITQKTEDVVGPYELHDFFLYYLLRFGFGREKILFLAQQAFRGDYSEEVIGKWLSVFLRRFVQQQFKRSCMPDGPKVGSVNLSPRGDWRMPSDSVPFL